MSRRRFVRREADPIDLHTHIPGADFIVLPEAAHSINWEQPEAFNPQRPGVHPQALASNGTKIVIHEGISSVRSAWQTAARMVFLIP